MTEPEPEEEQGLEEGVGAEVEDPGPEGPHAAGQEHVAELAHRGVGQHPLDVVLDQADGGREDRGERPDQRHHQHRLRGVGVDRRRARHHVDAGGDHGGGVDEGGDRGRALHGVGQPDVERNLRALAGGPDEQEQADQGEGAPPGVLDRHVSRRGRDRLEVEGAEGDEDQEDPDQEAGVTDPVDDEGLLAGVGGALLLEPEPDEEVGAQPHALPAHEEHHVVGAQDQREHGEHEQVQVRHVPRVAGVVTHVPDRVDVDQEADEGDDQDHDRGERVQEVAPLHLEGSGTDDTVDHRLRGASRDPGPQGLGQEVIRCLVRRQRRTDRDEEGRQDRSAGHQADDRRRRGGVFVPGVLLRPAGEQAHSDGEIEEEAEERK